MKITVKNEGEMQTFGKRLGSLVHGGEVIELVGDVGAGKTTLTKAIAEGMGISAPVHSPTFTISNQYETGEGPKLVHYDFYRLNDAGIMQDELAETIGDHSTVTVIEWGEVVRGVLPDARIRITFTIISEDGRELTLHTNGPLSEQLAKELQ